MSNLFCFLIFCFVLQVDGVTPAVEKSNDTETDNVKFRCLHEAHSYLLSQSKLRPKKFRWSINDRLIYELSVLAEVVKVGAGEQQIKLDDDTQRVVYLFDQLVIRGENVGEISEVELSIGDFVQKELGGRREMKGDGVAFDLGMFQLPPKDIREVVQLRITSQSPVTINGISLKSSRGISKDYSSVKKHWFEFTAGRNSDLQRTFFLQVRSQDLAQLSSSLGQNSRIFNKLIRPQAMYASEDVNLNAILGDRRVSKLYELLKALDRDQAAKLAREMYVLQFAKFQEVLDRSIVPHYSRHALESKLFLCSEFCTTDEVAEQMKSWKSWHEANLDGRSNQFKYGAGPDFLFFANLKVNVVAKGRGYSIGQANTWLEGVIAPVTDPRSIPVALELSEKWLLTSDSTPNRQDGLARVPFMSYSGPFKNRKDQLRVLDMIDEAIKQESP